jgi:hypothetical protein
MSEKTTQMAPQGAGAQQAGGLATELPAIFIEIKDELVDKRERVRLFKTILGSYARLTRKVYPSRWGNYCAQFVEITLDTKPQLRFGRYCDGWGDRPPRVYKIDLDIKKAVKLYRRLSEINTINEFDELYLELSRRYDK